MKVVKINNQSLKVEKDFTIIQACLKLGIEIPRFCYHDRLSIAGNCRMCLVEVKKSIKPVASCAVPLVDGMEIFTKSILVKKAREGILEFLLVNHPLDCPICDQGGECDLQDQAMVFGSDRGRFYDYKRSVEDKDCGPFIKTLMTRCIHCTRCIRFIRELGGVYEFGTTGRGSKMEVGTYISKNLESELSGNIIDLCPVGALTSKPYSFIARPWELQYVNSIDLSDSLCSNIRIDFRGSDIMRILPRLNEQINEEWLSDIGRFNYDGLKYQRLYFPMIRKQNVLKKVTWKEAFNYLKFQFIKRGVFDSKVLNKNKVLFNFYIGSQNDAESLVILSNLASKFGKKCNFFYEDSFSLNSVFRSDYLMSFDLSMVKKYSLFLLVGLNPRLESPILNLQLRKAFISHKLIIGSIGYNLNAGYSINQLGNSLKIFTKFIEGNHWFCNFLLKSNNPLMLIGNGVYNRKDSKGLLFGLKYSKRFITKQFIYCNNWWKNVFFFQSNLINYFLNFSGSINILELGDQSFLNCSQSFNLKNKNNIHYLFNYNKSFKHNFNNDFIIYHGSHGDWGASNSNIIFPSSSYVEKTGLYLNSFGLVQEIKNVFYPVGEALFDWQLLVGLGDLFFFFLDYNDLAKIRSKLINLSPLFILNNNFFYNKNLIFLFFDFSFCKYFTNSQYVLLNSSFNSEITSSYKIKSSVVNKFSKNMSNIQKEFNKNFSNFYSKL